MAGNTFGKAFRVTTWGESHGPGVGAVIDGCPPGIIIDESLLQKEMDRRKPGGGGAASPRREPDQLEILSGVYTFDGESLPRTTGTPIALAIFNKDANSKSYNHLKDVFRPGHGDMTYLAKYGLRDHRGGGRASARETAARVAAGAIAKQILDAYDINVVAYTVALGGVETANRDLTQISKNNFFCPDKKAAVKMAERVTEVKKAGDTVGGIVEIVAQCPPGLGNPVFDKLDGELAHGLMSIGAVKGVEIGAGFKVAGMLGSQNNDEISSAGYLSNNAGGILAGISNGEAITIRVAVKPIPSHGKKQKTVNISNDEIEIKVGGRHDISAIPRIIPVCEAMVRLTLVDQLLRHLGPYEKIEE